MDDSGPANGIGEEDGVGTGLLGGWASLTAVVGGGGLHEVEGTVGQAENGEDEDGPQKRDDEGDAGHFGVLGVGAP